MAEPIGALRVDLSADAAQFEKDMGKARDVMRSAASSMSADFKAMASNIDKGVKSLMSWKAAAVVAAGVTGLALLIQNAIDSADAIAKTSRAVGVSAETFQELSYAAGLAGVDSDKFTSALEHFSKVVGDARNGTGALVTTLQDTNPALLASVKSAPNVESAFNIIADAADGMGSSMDRNTVLAAAFGREAGVTMANMTAGGTKALAAMRQEARSLGLVIDNNLIASAEPAADQLDRMGRILSVTLTRALLNVTPQVVALGQAFIDHIKPFADWVIQHLPDATATAAELARRIADTEAQLQALTGVPLDTLLSDVTDLNVAFGANAQKVMFLLHDLRNLDDLWKKAVAREAELNKTITATGNTVDAQQAKREVALQKNIAALEASAKAEALSGEAKTLNNALTSAQNTLLDAQGKATRDLTDAERERIANAVKLADVNKRDVALKNAIYAGDKANLDTVIGIGIAADTRTAIIAAQNTLIDEQGNKTRDLTDAEKDHIAATVEEHARLQQLQDSYSELADFGSQAFDRIGSSITDAFTKGSGAAIDFGSVVDGVISELVQEFIKLAAINPFKNALFGTSAPTLDSVGGILGGLLGGGGGAILPSVAQDASLTNVGGAGLGFATGGSFTVGGVGGTDKNVVKFRATRGERVTIQTPGQQVASDGAGSRFVQGDVTVNITTPPGTKATTKQSQDSQGGRTVDILIDEAMAKAVNTPGSRTGRALRTTFGANQTLAAR